MTDIISILGLFGIGIAGLFMLFMSSMLFVYIYVTVSRSLGRLRKYNIEKEYIEYD